MSDTQTPDEAFLIGISNDDPDVNRIYGDYLTEKGQESLAAVLERLDDLIGASLKRNLSATSNTRWHYHETGQASVGQTVTVYWHGSPIITLEI